MPKVLHPVGGIPMVNRVVTAAQAAGAREARVVVGFGENWVRQAVEPLGAVCFRQQEQKGTANAVQAAQPESLEGIVVILNGDHPLITTDDIQKFVNGFVESKAELLLVTCELEDPGSYGRVVRRHGEVYAIVEAKDASHESKKIREINTGIYVLNAQTLASVLPQIEPHNQQREFYLTDIVAILSEQGKKVAAFKAPSHVSAGVNTQAELALVTAEVFSRKCLALMDEGVIIVDPRSTYIEDTVRIGAGSTLFPNVYLRGDCELGARVVVEPGAMLKDSRLGDGVVVKAGTYMDQAAVGAGSEVGPYAHLRPGSVIGDECKIGNFVETKKIKMGDRTKASHLTYLGDATIGSDTNIGCGTITCNYAVDKKKYETRIGSHVFVGSDTQFIAPISIGDHAVIGSGSTITKDVPARALAVARGKQFIKENYVSEVAPSSPSEKAAEKSAKE